MQYLKVLQVVNAPQAVHFPEPKGKNLTEHVEQRACGISLERGDAYD